MLENLKLENTTKSIVTQDLQSVNSLLEKALDYADLDWAVLPLHSIVDGKCSCGDPNCGSPGKHPRTPHGVKDATTDPKTIIEWWTKWPDANIGIATGSKSGFFVLDVDGEEGQRSLNELQAKYETLPETLETATGGGGRHLLFMQPPGLTIKNKVRIAPGLDIRGDGGYIVAPPSNHISGKRYEWVNYADVMLAEAPAWLLDLITNNTMQDTRHQNPTNELNLAAKVLDGVPEGERNNTLFRYACRLRAQGLTYEEAKVLVLEAARRCDPPLPEKEALQIVKSAWNYRESYHLTDLGNAERLVSLHGQELRYCHPWSRWLVWDGRRWKIDDTAEVKRRAKEVIRLMYAEASNIEDKTDRQALVNFAMKSEQNARITAMVELAASEEGIPVLPQDLDTDPWLLNVANGTLDLKKGQLRPHNRYDLITKITDVVYDETAKAPRWEKFLNEIMDGNQAIVQFLQKAAGMSLTGDTSDHVLLVLYGRGRNGKSTFLNTLLSVMGDYAIQSPPDLLIVKNNDRHPTELADLFGKRLVVSIESEQGRRLAEALVKQLTGGDKIKARRMREDFWEFWPTHHIWFATNHKPLIRGTDPAIWSRIKLVPFNVQFLDGDPRQDKHLFQKLQAELPGILRWCVEGCLLWQKEGLEVPKEVIEATESYRAEQDVIAAFFNDCCVTDPQAKTPVKELYKAYQDWCEENGEHPLSQRELGARLVERGYERFRGGKNGSYVWRGLGLAGENSWPQAN